MFDIFTRFGLTIRQSVQELSCLVDTKPVKTEPSAFIMSETVAFLAFASGQASVSVCSI